MIVNFIISLMCAYAADACQDGWMSHAGECYHFSHDEEIWVAAMDVCHLMGASLVEVNNAAEDQYLRSQIRNAPGDEYWIGLSDLQDAGQFQWMTSSEKITSDSFTNWHDNQPDNDDGREHCVSYWLDDGDIKWNDAPCHDIQRYICEKRSDLGTDIIG